MNIFKKFMLGTVAMFALSSCSDKTKQEEVITPKEKFAKFIFNAIDDAESIKHGYTRILTLNENMDTVVNEKDFIEVVINRDSEIATELLEMQSLGEDANSGVPNFNQKGSGVIVQDNGNQITMALTKDVYMATQDRTQEQTEQDLISAHHVKREDGYSSKIKPQAF